MRPTIVLPRPPRPDLRAGAASREPLRLRRVSGRRLAADGLSGDRRHRPQRFGSAIGASSRRFVERRLVGSIGHRPAAPRRRLVDHGLVHRRARRRLAPRRRAPRRTAPRIEARRRRAPRRRARRSTGSSRPARPAGSSSRAPSIDRLLGERLGDDGLVHRPAPRERLTTARSTHGLATGRSAARRQSLPPAPACAAGSSAHACRTGRPSRLRRSSLTSACSSTIWGSSAAGSS